MTDEGFVSAWIGNATSRDVLDRAVEVEYSEDGDLLGSPFSRAFGIGRYDDDVREVHYHETIVSGLSDLLRGASYDDVVIPRLANLVSEPIEGNCVILLYNYRHDGPSEWDTEGFSLRYVGAVAYR